MPVHPTSCVVVSDSSADDSRGSGVGPHVRRALCPTGTDTPSRAGLVPDGDTEASVVPTPGAAAVGPPLVSIIIITYNDRRHVGEAISSALAQTYSNCEVIVVDDGSTDGTDAFVGERYGRLVRYLRKQNGGMGSARAAGLELASGVYVQMFDSDDVFLPHKIERQVRYLQGRPDLAFVYGRSLCFYDDDPSKTWEHPDNARARSGNLFDEIICRGNFVNVAQPLFRRAWLDRVGGWDPAARASDDYDMMVRLAYAGAVCDFVDEPVFMYRKRRGGDVSGAAETWRWPESRYRGVIYLLRKLHGQMRRDSRSELRLVECSLGHLEFGLGRALAAAGDRRGATAAMVRGLWLNRERGAKKAVLLCLTCILPLPLVERLHRVRLWLRNGFGNRTGPRHTSGFLR